MTEDAPRGKDTSTGFIKDFIASVGTHIEERVKSPFAGAFAASWLVINWKSLLILAFSNSTIETRIAATSETFTTYSALWHPLWLSALLTLGFYFISAVFSFFIELYDLSRKTVEKLFDNARWTPPGAYIELKRKFAEKVSYLEGLAADNLSIVDDVRKKELEANGKLLEAQQHLAERIGLLSQRTEEVADLRRSLLELKDSHSTLEKIVADSPSDPNVIMSLALQLGRLHSDLEDRSHYRNGAISNELIDIAKTIENLYVQARDAAAILRDSPLDIDRLRIYLVEKFPDLPINEKLLKQVFSDMKNADLLPVLSKNASLDALFDRSRLAVEKYANEQPSLFKSSVDYLSKSSGFVYPEFRRIHRFGEQTLQAFHRLENLAHPA